MKKEKWKKMGQREKVVWLVENDEWKGSFTPEQKEQISLYGFKMLPQKGSKMRGILEELLRGGEPTSLHQFLDHKVMGLPAYIYSLKAMGWKIKNLKKKGKPAQYQLDPMDISNYKEGNILLIETNINTPKFDHGDDDDDGGSSPAGSYLPSRDRQSFNIGGSV